MTDNLKAHPLAEIFPGMPQDEFDALVDDVRTKGCALPILTYEGKVLDGWHRYRACVKAGVKPTIQPYRGDDPVAFVVSMNLRRRHLTRSEQAVTEALAMKQTGQLPDKSPTEARLRRGEHPDQTVANLARSAHISNRIASQAVRVVRSDPELARRVLARKQTLDKADEIIAARQAKKIPPRATAVPSPGDEWRNHRGVQDILAFVRAWDEEMPKTIASIKAGKFSPEAKRFLGHKLRPTARRLVDFCDWLDR